MLSSDEAAARRRALALSVQLQSRATALRQFDSLLATSTLGRNAT
jgi:hypothetical protein